MDKLQLATTLAIEAEERAVLNLVQQNEKQLALKQKAERIEKLVTQYFCSQEFLDAQVFVAQHESAVGKEYETGSKFFSRAEKISVQFFGITNFYKFFVCDKTVNYCWRYSDAGTPSPKESSLADLCFHLARKECSPEESLEFFKEEFNARIRSLIECYLALEKPNIVHKRKKRNPWPLVFTISLLAGMIVFAATR